MASLLFATDLHGNRAAYGRLLDYALARGVDAVVLGGDITPLPPHEGERVRPQREFLETFLRRQLRDFSSLQSKCRVWLLMGNDDWACNMDVLEALERENLCRLLHLRAQPFLDDFWIAGYSCVPVTPFLMKDWDRFDRPGWEPRQKPAKALWSKVESLIEVSVDGDVRARGTIADDLGQLAYLSDPARTIYVCHTPPHGTKLDVLYDGTHIGSEALREFLLRHRPPLSLHGHIHESPRMSGSICDRVGRTFCINPGESLHDLQAVYLDPYRPEETLDML
ncbi:MAG: metallophosphoesterase [Planctomycetes bacterium]|nr:metallophosphoesterase [Planctomycetota bacterium]